MNDIDVKQFLDAIFPFRADPGVGNTGESVVLAIQPEGGNPGRAVPESEVERVLARSDRARKATAFYFGTASVFEVDGEVRNRNDRFCGAYCLVLDDIGTKLPRDQVPEAFREPSWIMETSPGNFQYGYIYEDIIEDVAVAQAVVDQVVHGVGADTGGNLACKLVRLPAGHNLKDQHRGPDGSCFAVRLVEWNPDRWFLPKDLMKWAGCSVTWEDLQRGVRGALQRDSRRVLGTTAFRNVEYHDGGVVDEVAEWLIEQGLVIETLGTWWTIRCPWWRQHSSQDEAAQTAGYSPLGAQGGAVPKGSRRFHCFHSHEEGSTSDFLRWVQDQGGPACAEHDLAAPELARWALDMEQATWINVRDGGATRLRDAGFKAGMQRPVFIPGRTPSGKPRMASVPLYKALVESPSLLRVHGTRFDPGAPLVIEEGDLRVLNDCKLPAWGEGDVDQGLVEPVLEFIDYLIPDEKQREWFLSHLAMKARDPKYRGHPIFMSTPTTGTGRGTLAWLLGQLWGQRNVGTPGYGDFVNALTGRKAFNTELRRLWIVVDEVAAGIDGTVKRGMEEFEVLKRFCDPAPVHFEFNRKYGAAWSEDLYSSVILCSNHSDALAADRHDRRFVHINNPLNARPAAWFRTFKAWCEGSDWEPALWRWLLAREVDEASLVQNLAQIANDFREEAAFNRDGLPENLVQLALEYVDKFHGGVVVMTELVPALEAVSGLVKLTHPQRMNAGEIFARLIRKATVGVRTETGYFQVRWRGEPTRPRLTAVGERMIAGGAALLAQDVRDAWAEWSPVAFETALRARMRDLKPHALLQGRQGLRLVEPTPESGQV